MKCITAMSFVLALGCRLILLVPTSSDAIILIATRPTTNHSRTEGFSRSGFSRVKTIHSSSSHTLFVATSDDSVRPASSRIPSILFVLNAATKWLVSIAVTTGVLWNPKSFRGPYIVVGSIGATVLASKLKRLINQGRPDGAPFTDPGMPSSHALVSFFVATSWGQHIGGYWTMTSALGVSVLRVVCGYHTLPQIVVGGLLGTLLGSAWMATGGLLHLHYPNATFVTSWATYLIGSALYIRKEATRWLTDEKFL